MQTDDKSPKNIPVLTPYNPLDKKNLGAQVMSALLKEPVHSLPPSKFIGAGVYAIYYKGVFETYQPISCRDDNYYTPIYVGKAVPEGARKAGKGLAVDQGFALYRRLNDHAKSIEAATNLRLEDFKCQFLATDDIWIPLAETILIEKFLPLWNCLLEVFGNHAPGKGRKDMITPAWDCYHPGREWSKHLKPHSKTREQLDVDIRDFLRQRACRLYSTVNEVL